ncbi:hypothetical protein [Plantactinospora endophytica]|uniref:WXG100 family type VII secretion target n=1 Tax=Plantactinospora endophytica TaxID=673535 RepID=A0ABQ4EAF9_9ACTN|nr:hypothetical protein [Plantactinospora endophytica]GIG91678.1 hypothetical protein Pen02_66140 [Plantactinospora endophytica]
MSPVGPSVGAAAGAAIGAAAAAVIGQINVEIDGLSSAAAAMREELKEGYRTQVPPVHDAMQQGATIGDRLEGDDWLHLQERYDECIQKSLEALVNLDKGTQAVARAADQIATNYRGSDAFAHATVSDVHEVLPPTEQTRPQPGTDPAAPTGSTGGAGNG